MPQPDVKGELLRLKTGKWLPDPGKSLPDPGKAGLSSPGAGQMAALGGFSGLQFLMFALFSFARYASLIAAPFKVYNCLHNPGNLARGGQLVHEY